MPHQHERAHYRIEYPPRARLRFVADGGRVWPVDNCSELGFRYQTADAPLAEGELPALEARVSGRIEFHDGALVAVTATVVRVTGGDVAVRLDSPGVPLPVIWAEQRYLLSRYPGLSARQES